MLSTQPISCQLMEMYTRQRVVFEYSSVLIRPVNVIDLTPDKLAERAGTWKHWGTHEVNEQQPVPAPVM